MRIVFPLAAILALRFFGLFLVMPLLALHVLSLDGGTPFMAGVAVGGYALFQMLFQYPFGRLSDRFGRRLLIAIGLGLFAIGSVVCALAESAEVMVLGRFIQGIGAVSAVITATIGDLVGEEKRSAAMAIMGGSIALSFVVALLIGPIMGARFGVESLFWLTAGLSLVAIVILITKVPTPPRARPFGNQASGSTLKRVAANRNLMRLSSAMFLHSFVMTAIFILIPLSLTREFGWQMGDLWKIYLPSVFFGIGAMAIGAMLGERFNRVKTVMIVAIVILLTTFIVMGLWHQEQAFLVTIVLLFVGINMIEPLMQSSATKFAKAADRGAALGVFNSAQFFGVFIGGVSAGGLFGWLGFEVLSFTLAGVALLWLIATLGVDNPIRMKLLSLDPAMLHDNLGATAIEATRGVADCWRDDFEDRIFVRYNPALTDEDTLKKTLLQ
jgi:predicted MFS family arabinose efflux permease